MRNLSLALIILFEGFLLNHVLQCYVALKRGSKNLMVKSELIITLIIMAATLVAYVIWSTQRG